MRLACAFICMSAVLANMRAVWVLPPVMSMFIAKAISTGSPVTFAFMAEVGWVSVVVIVSPVAGARSEAITRRMAVEMAFPPFMALAVERVATVVV